jgi:uncharacterized membrane protein YhaH (DUF805 family)
MWSTLFGFRGCIGRLKFLLLLVGAVLVSISLPALVGIAFGLAFHGGSARAIIHRHSLIVIGTMLVVWLPVFLWVSFALQAKRFRDMGWNPLYAILGWLAANTLDRIAVALMPSLAFGHQKHSVVGLVINIVMVGCLLFWPGTEFDAGRGNDEREQPISPLGRIQREAPQPAIRVAGNVGGASRPRFGRRT